MRDRRSARALVWAIDRSILVYQLTVRPLLAPSCRFAPSCSEYARDAVRRHGASAGIRLAARRVLRCHPLADGGWDPVPERVD